MRKFTVEWNEEEALDVRIGLEQAIVILTNRCKAGMASSEEVERGLRQLQMVIEINKTLWGDRKPTKEFKKEMQRLYGYKGYLTSHLEAVKAHEEWVQSEEYHEMRMKVDKEYREWYLENHPEAGESV